MRCFVALVHRDRLVNFPFLCLVYPLADRFACFRLGISPCPRQTGSLEMDCGPAFLLLGLFPECLELRARTYLRGGHRLCRLWRECCGTSAVRCQSWARHSTTSNLPTDLVLVQRLVPRIHQRRVIPDFFVCCRFHFECGLVQACSVLWLQWSLTSQRLNFHTPHVSDKRIIPTYKPPQRTLPKVTSPKPHLSPCTDFCHHQTFRINLDGAVHCHSLKRRPQN